jgi:hypothetical protein
LAQLGPLLGGIFGGWQQKQFVTFLDPTWTSASHFVIVHSKYGVPKSVMLCE